MACLLKNEPTSYVFAAYLTPSGGRYSESED